MLSVRTSTVTLTGKRNVVSGAGSKGDTSTVTLYIYNERGTVEDTECARHEYGVVTSGQEVVHEPWHVQHIIEAEVTNTPGSALARDHWCQK